MKKKLTKNRYFAFVSHHSDFYLSIWEDLAKVIVREQEFGRCANCGSYFVTDPKGHDRKYCSPECQERYKKIRKYRLKKIK